MSRQAEQNPVRSKAAFQWAEGLGKVFKHVALFQIRGTLARVAGVYGLSDVVIGRSLSLTAQTPLRWSLDAASALVSSGNSPGGAILSKGLGLARPRAFAVLPLLIDGKLVAIAYVDNGDAALSMATVSKVFGIVDASLRNDITYVRELRHSVEPKPNPALKTEPPVLGNNIPSTFDALTDDEQRATQALPGFEREQYQPEPDDLDEIEAMLDEALADNPIAQEDESGPVDNSVPVIRSLQEHIESKDESVRQLEPLIITEQPEPLVSLAEGFPEVDPVKEESDEQFAAMSASVEPREPVVVQQVLPPPPIKRRLHQPPALKSPAEKRHEREMKLRQVILEAEDNADSQLEPQEDFELIDNRWTSPKPHADVKETRSDAPPAPNLKQFTQDAEPPPPSSPGKVVFLDKLRLSKFQKQMLIAASVVALVGASVVGMLAPPAGGPPAGFTFRIHPNSSLKQIGTHLERQGVIRSGVFFTLLAKLRGAERGLRAGRYSIPQGAWAWNVLNELKQGQVRTRSVTIPEGLTLQETAEIIEASGLVTVEKFLKAARSSELIQAYGIVAPTAEGYLFPETYTFAEELSAEDIVKEMLDLFFTRFTQLADKREMGPTELMEYVTLASIIEREAKAPNEMPRIAGVFRNRLTRNMRLESCATVQYILGKPKERLLLSDLRKESPYNTYLKPGLPPGPISNPGFEALKASFLPEEHSYLFFLAKNDGSNEHIFTQTYAQHQKARLRQKQAEPR